MAVSAACLAMGAAACTGSAPARVKTPGELGVAAAAVSESAFGASVHRILRDGSATPERQALLVGVVQRQLAHAAARFDAGQPERGTASVMGALALVRPGEGQLTMLDGAGGRAFDGAIERVAARGDEGRARALLTMRAASLPPGSPVRKAAEAQLVAIDEWLRDVKGNGPSEALSTEARVQLARAMIDPSPKTQDAAATAISMWIERAAEYDRVFQRTGAAPEGNEALETARALDLGAPLISLLGLRAGDFKKAFDLSSSTSAKLVARPALLDRLRAAAKKNSARAARSVAAMLLQQSFADRDPDGFRIEPELIEAAVFGVVVEAYRLEPTHFETARLLARMLVRAGLSEAAPFVLVQAVRADPATHLGGALEVVGAAMVIDARADDPDTVRRTFVAAMPLMQAAERGRPTSGPTVSDLRAVMAEVELGAANLGAARALFEASAREAPSVATYLTLARIARQASRPDEAAGYLSRALRLPAPQRRALEGLEALELRVFAAELERERGASARAQQAFDAVLVELLAARSKATESGAKVTAERLLARVLDHYGDVKGANRALDRALAAAANHHAALNETVLDAVAHAFVHRDVEVARTALQRGIEAEADDDDLLYGALWVHLLEKQLRVKTDGTADRAMANLNGGGTFLGKLAAWGQGRATDAELVKAARTPAQRAKAAFYVALSKQRGDAASDPALRAVAQSQVLDVPEVEIARALVAPRPKGALPPNVKLP